MILTIDNDADFEAMCQEYNVERRTIPYLCRVLAMMFRDQQELEIHMHRDILKQTYSYILNPTQLAKSCNADQAWIYTAGHVDSPYVKLRFFNTEPKPKFFEQAAEAARNGDTVKFTREEVPDTYWHTPSLLRYRLRTVTGRNARVQKGKDWLKVVCPRL